MATSGVCGGVGVGSLGGTYSDSLGGGTYSGSVGGGVGVSILGGSSVGVGSVIFVISSISPTEVMGSEASDKLVLDNSLMVGDDKLDRANISSLDKPVSSISDVIIGSGSSYWLYIVDVGVIPKAR